MTTEAEVWRTRYQVLKSAVVGVCAAAADKSMTGRECIELVKLAVKAVEDGGKLDVERETEGEEPANVAGGD